MIEILGGQYDEDWLTGLEQSFQQFVNDLTSAAYGEMDDLVTETELYFCGCDTCFSREILAFLIPKVAAAVKAGKAVV